MDALRKLKDKKGMSKMNPMEQKAKMDVLGDLRDMAQNAMGSKLKGGMGKVTVASNSPSGLESGLDKAQSILKDLPSALDDSHPDHENFAHTENDEDGMDGMSEFPDADGDHLLEADPMAAHEEDEEAEGYAHGGMVDPSKFDHMDESELDAHLEHLMKLKAQKGKAK